jgi:hypothetical protein
MEDVVISEEPVWVPSANRVSEATMTKFRAFASERARMPLSDTPALHAWSLSDFGAFWEAVWDYFSVVGEKGKEQLVDGDRMLAARFFPDAQLNLAENLLAGGAEREGTSDALVFRGEDGPTRRWSWDELRNEVSRLQHALAALGVGPGDRVAGLLPNCPRRWRRCSRPFLWVQFGPRHHRILACEAYSIASGRSSQRFSSQPTATGMPGSGPISPPSLPSCSSFCLLSHAA